MREEVEVEVAARVSAMAILRSLSLCVSLSLSLTVDDVGGDSKARDSARPDVLVRGLPLAGHDVVGAGLVAPGVLPKVDSRGKGQNWILGDPVGVLQEVKVSPPRIEGSHGLAGGRVVVVPAQLHRPSPVIRLSIDQSKPAKIAKICQNSGQKKSEDIQRVGLKERERERERD